MSTTSDSSFSNLASPKQTPDSSFFKIIRPFIERTDNTLITFLDADPREQQFYPNRETRPMKFGHFLRILPTPLKDPTLITYSKDMAQRLGITDEMAKSGEFLSLFSANGAGIESWCTPYAVSVNGQPIPHPCQYRGYAYGDGRACSIGEFRDTKSSKGEVAEGEQWELQLKGCGPTIFSRNFDGRAVLRSSIREFLASEAMYALHVPTTRALSLVMSNSETVGRAWYKSNVFSEKHDFPPNYMIEEKCAITCRAASSFLRVGQVELYSRRLVNGDDGAEESMKKFVSYCIRREFPSLVETMENNFQQSVVGMIRLFAQRQAKLVYSWIRVGYVQGNMNSDNCLLAGLTMDYGPFGYLESYHPLWTPFTSDPARNFGFERQVTAAYINLGTLSEALLHLIKDNEELVDEVKDIVRDEYPKIMDFERTTMRKGKLGINDWKDDMDEKLWDPIYEFLPGVDYTLFWRKLSELNSGQLSEHDSLEKIKDTFDLITYVDQVSPEINDKRSAKLLSWISVYSTYVKADLDSSNLKEEDRLTNMKKVNPKYIPREWMLVEAYEKAQKNDFSLVLELQELFLTPFDEHPSLEDKYYRVTPNEYRRKAGVSFFSCSS